MSGLPTSPEHHPFRLTLEGAAQTTLTMQPFPESAVLGWVLGLSITALVIACMIVGLIARLWPCTTHS